MPLSAVQASNGSFPFQADLLDVLMLRRLLQLPRLSDGSFLAGAKDFANVLALLRQHSRACIYAEAPRLAGFRILPEAAEVSLEITAAPKAGSEDAVTRVLVRARFRDPDERSDLGWPLARNGVFWTFARHICPPSPLPHDPRLRGVMLQAEGVAQEFAGDAALEVLFHARAAANANEILLKLDPALAVIPVSAQPLKREVRVDVDSAGNLDVVQQVVTPDGRVVPEPVLAAQAGTGWVDVSGRRYRAPEAAPFRLPAARKLKGEEIPKFLTEELPLLRAAGDVNSPWNVYVGQAVDGAHKIKDEAAAVRVHLDVEEEEDGTWFTLDAAFEHDGNALSEEDLREMLRKGQKWFRKDGSWVKLDSEALEKFEQHVKKSGAQRQFGGRKKLYYRFKPSQRERVTDIFSLTGTMEHTEKYQKFLERLRDFRMIERRPSPRDFKLTLRPYQQQGFEWMRFLAQYGLNGILADDMGLGKTAQTIALLSSMKEEFGQAPSLIVTPTSLADNWRNECLKFNPALKVLIYRGGLQRRDKLRREIQDYDVVLGTYAMVRNDALLLREFDWRYVILDEAHFIKNSAAATTKAIKTIPARHRLALTGTPIQNRLGELWSLFDFLMPDFLGRQMRFRENFEEPIARLQSGLAGTKEERETGEQAMRVLRERIQPFVLRRLKTDVATELPPKIENDIFCTLCPEQVALYRNFANSAEAKDAVSELAAKGADGACTAILAALTSLRKICNHADLMWLPKNAGRQRIAKPLPGYEARSGKLEALGELLQQCQDGAHRALIFCQQTTMLDILGHFLDERGIKHMRLDGESAPTGRQAMVDQFNGDASYQVFLISTRAGGTGLNLTSADTVIFYDHDWNPANDQQAQDRAYRIGQKRTVNVYRLICKGTLEEKILRRQAIKRAIAKSIIHHDASGMKQLTRDDLIGLFTLDETAVRPADAGGGDSAADARASRARAELEPALAS